MFWKAATAAFFFVICSGIMRTHARIDLDSPPAAVLPAVRVRGQERPPGEPVLLFRLAMAVAAGVRDPAEFRCGCPARRNGHVRFVAAQAPRDPPAAPPGR